MRDVADHRRCPLAREAESDGNSLEQQATATSNHNAIDSQLHAAGIVLFEQGLEGRVEQRLEVQPNGFLEKAAVEQRGQRVRKHKADSGTPLADETRRRYPFPWRTVS